jgi:hypothetical protein
MNIREMRPDDIEKLRELHEKFYSDLTFPDFTHFYFGFVITDESDDIIMAGGLRPLAEIILVTNKDKSQIKIGRALIEARNLSVFAGKKTGLDELVAFIKGNENYKRHLLKHGFYPRSSAIAIRC